MTSSFLRAVPALILFILSFGFAGCSSLGGALPGGLADVLGSVTGFTSGVSNWQSTLGSALNGTQLSQLADYANQAGNLGTQISGFTDGLGQAMSDPLGAIGSQLQDMSGIDVNRIQNLAPSAQQQAVGNFTDSASNVGSLTQDFLQRFGG